MRRLSQIAVPCAVLLLAAWARLAPWEHVFGGAHPALLGDTDAHYHVLRAERWLVGAPGAPWRDPALDWPYGAPVPWPPLFDLLLAGAGRLAGGAVVERDTLVAAASLVPVALGLLFVILTAALGRRLLGAGAGWISALVVAFTSAGVDPSRVGRTDQHVLETVLFTALLLVLVPPTAPRRRPGLHGAWAALLIALAFWSWMGSGFHLLVLLAITAALHLLPREDEGGAADHAAVVLAAGGLGGSLLLAATVAIWGAPGALREANTTGVGGLQVALAAAAGTFALVLHLARRRWPGTGLGRRALALAAASLPGLLLLALPSVREGLGGGLRALTAGDAWYRQIDEFRPLLAADRGVEAVLLMLLRGYGLTPLLLPLGALAVATTWRSRAIPRPALLTVAALCVLLIPLTLLRKRFGVYAVIPVALATELALMDCARRVLRRLTIEPTTGRSRALGLSAALVVVAPSALEHGLQDTPLPPDQVSVLEWIAQRPPAPGREAVLAPWTFGHAIQFFAGRPVVTSPFGTAIGEGGMRASAAFWHARTPRDAEAVLARRRVGLLLLGPVISETATLQAFAPPGTAVALDDHGDITRLREWTLTPRFDALVPTRLYYGNGSGAPGRAALDGFRLLAETDTTSPDVPAAETRWMLFEPVDGARVVVSGVRSTVHAEVDVITNADRAFTWRTEAAPGPDGTASLRLPYASGPNGGVQASAWRIGDGSREIRFVAHEEDVLLGRVHRIALGATAPVTGR